MENLVNLDPIFWKNRSVLVTGHTGFKGGWLTIWLHQLGARVHGYALDPVLEPNLYDVARVGSFLASDTRSDLADLACLKQVCGEAQPEVVFHLAAQPLVRESYRDPLGTLASNVMGTAHVLEAVRLTESVKAVVVVTTDKVYENREWVYPYREIDPLGGHDPYSASKAAAEIVTAAYRSSFFTGKSGHAPRVATARAGNVIGGGDWAIDRLVPDSLRSFTAGGPVQLRFPSAVRPWQHVFESLSGYLILAQRLLGKDGGEYAQAWNFGPETGDDATVGRVAEILAELWGEGARVMNASASENPHEAGLLRLDSTKAREILGWKNRWHLQRALAETVSWQQAWKKGADMALFSLEQIRTYSAGKS